MTQEEKRLLLQDLCTRLPYEVKIQTWYSEIITSDLNTFTIGYDEIDIEQLAGMKPYLRQMSSMTEEEKTEFRRFITWIFDCNYQANTLKEVLNGNEIETNYIVELFDWLNAHHFDYRGLIPMGLALEAPEGMYVIK